MLGLPGELVITIPDAPPFYSLYADGLLARKTHFKESAETLLVYPPDALLVLYYTYPAYRTACVVRNTSTGGCALPGLSKKVNVLFNVRASKVDKLRRAVSFLNAHGTDGGRHVERQNAYRFDDGFYIRLYFILQQRGKLNYTALRSLIEKQPP